MENQPWNTQEERPLDRLLKCTLHRDETGKFYLYGPDGKIDKELSRHYGIPDVFVLTPGKKSIEKFAALNYLFSLLGIKVKEFTACKDGYLATFVDDKGEQQGTYFTGDSLVLLNDVLQLAENNNRQDIVDIIERAAEKGQSLLDICKIISSNIDKPKNPLTNNNFFTNFKAVNDNNCDRNHELICRLLCNNSTTDLCQQLINLRNIDLLSSDLSEEEIRNKISELERDALGEEDEAEKQKIQAKINEYNQVLSSPELLEQKRLYDGILFGTILPGYFTYIGKTRAGDPLKQDGMVLNKKAIISDLAKLLGYTDETFQNIKSPEEKRIAIEKVEKLALLLNIASTDYSADFVQAIFGDLLNGEKLDENEIIPPTEEFEQKPFSPEKNANLAFLGLNRNHVGNTLADTEGR